jgi:opacity protein-like surface antigen
MRTSRIFLLGLAMVLFAGNCFAQEYPKWEVGADYNYTRWNPSNFPAGTIAGTNQTFGNGHSLNGGGLTFTYNITGFLGIKADLQGLDSNTSQFLIPVGNAFVPKGGAFTVSGHLFTYTFGPELKFRRGRWTPYFQTLFGAADSNVYKNLDNAICVSQPIVGGTPSNCAVSSTFRNPSSNAFAMDVGGGLDIRLNRTLTIRAGEIDYFLTRFSATGNLGQATKFDEGNQNGLRVLAGLVFTF